MRRDVWIITALVGSISLSAVLPALGGEADAAVVLEQAFAVPSVFRSEPVWRDGTGITGFATIVRSIDVLREWVDSVQATDPEHYARIPDAFKSRLGNEEVYFWLWVHVADDVRRIVREGELVVTFTDETNVRATGMILFDPPGVDRAPQDSAVDPLVLEGRADPEHTGRNMYVFLPDSAAGKTIASVSRVRRGD